jgi:hypothetical protein
MTLPKELKNVDFVDEAFGKLVETQNCVECGKDHGGLRHGEWLRQEDLQPTPVLTPRDALLYFHEEVCAKAREIMAAKNHDYASDADPFRNFRTFGRYGILVRLSDKLARLRSFEEQGSLQVADEKIADTVLDIINYAVLYLGYEGK